MSASHQVYIRLISPHLKRSIVVGGWEMVPSMDELKALCSSCLEWLNWLKADSSHSDAPEHTAL